MADTTEEELEQLASNKFHRPTGKANQLIMANQLLLATGPQKKLAFIILLYVIANLLLLKKAYLSSGFHYTQLTVYIISCWMFNLLFGFFVIFKIKMIT